jgi:ubiquinone biosynthesis protein
MVRIITDASRITKFVAEASIRAKLANKTKNVQQFGFWLRNALADNGPTFIKAGQFLSSRNDILPAPVAKELRSLQDNVSPMSFDEVKKTIVQEMGCDNVLDVFESIESVPVASASIGQVHRAELKNGKGKVAVKIQKPNILESFEGDVKALRMLVEVGSAFGMRGKADISHVLNDLENQLVSEADFLLEASNIHRFRNSCSHMHWLHVPKTIDSFTSKRLLVMEFVDHDFKTSEIPRDFARKRITAHRLVELLMWMVLDGGLLHCDLHQGNVCLRNDGSIVLYDFGTVLDITPDYREVMKEIATHMYNNDPRKSVRLMLEAGMMVMKEGHRPEEAEKFFSVIIKSTRMDFDAADMHAAMGEPPFIASSSVFRLFRSMVMVEAACKSLDPEFSYFKYMRPFLGAQLMMMNLWES